MTVSEFINLVFLKQYKDVLMHPYIAFSLIFTGIEFLGKCLDEANEFDFYKKGLPEDHFNLALSNFFPPKYSNLDLFKYQRNGFAHLVRPKNGTKIKLGERKNISDETLRFKIPNLTLTTDEEFRVLFIEDFYEDFSNACQMLLKKIENRELNHPKLHGVFLEIKEYHIKYP